MRRQFAIVPVLALVHTALWAQSGDVVNAVRRAAWANDLVKAERLVADFRAQNAVVTPRLLEAISWAARGASFVKNWDKAEAYAREAYEGSQLLLQQRPLAADRSLPVALGAAIEVLGVVRDARGDRAGAVEFLRAERLRFQGSSIEMRIQKNIHLLSLEGKPAPEVGMTQWIGEKPKSIAALKGQVVLLFFWAHWCAECKSQMPALGRLAAEFSSSGLTIVGPTELFGYITRGAEATPEQELEYLRTEYQKNHPIPSWLSVPVGPENFRKLGISTTPTLLLVDRGGTVRMYHPGVLSYEALAAKIEPLLRPRT